MVATFGVENVDFTRWLVGFTILCVADFIWFRISWSIYPIDYLHKPGPPNVIPSELKTLGPAYFVAACAAVSAFTLAFIAGTDLEVAGAGALLGFTVFFVFNACTYYIINNIDDHGDSWRPQWKRIVSFIDTAYGTTIYALVALAINSLH